MNLGVETEPPPFTSPLKARWMRMMRSECGYGSGASRTALTTEKMAVLAPMPSARATTATAVNPGLPVRTRREWRRSGSGLLILIWYEQPWEKFGVKLALRGSRAHHGRDRAKYG